MDSSQGIKSLPLERATAENTAEFGSIIGPGAGVKPTSVDFYKGKVLMSYPVEFGCDHPVKVTLATVETRPFEVRYLERHFEHTQSFIPLNGKPFVAFLAPPTNGDMPDISQIRAFLFDGSEGFCLNRGTWHEFPFSVEDDTHIIVLLSTQTGYDLAERDPVTEEAFGPDLDKKDIASRVGIRFCLDENSINMLAQVS